MDEEVKEGDQYKDLDNGTIYTVRRTTKDRVYIKHNLRSDLDVFVTYKFLDDNFDYVIPKEDLNNKAKSCDQYKRLNDSKIFDLDKLCEENKTALLFNNSDCLIVSFEELNNEFDYVTPKENSTREIKVGDKYKQLSDNRIFNVNLACKEDDRLFLYNDDDDDYLIVNFNKLRDDFNYVAPKEDLPKTGNRKNDGKLKWHTFPKFLLKPLIEVSHFGSLKYASFNFLKGLSVNDTLDSLDRHLEAVTDPMQGDIDAESKCYHLAHVAWNALVSLYMIRFRSDLDDRYKGGE